MKASGINVKDLLKKFSFFKNNLALLVPILIAVVAILSFIPTTLLSRSLRSKIQTESVQASNEIDRLIHDVNQAAQAEAMKSYIDACAQDANQLDDLMKQTTLRELLDYQVFADPNQTSQLVFDPFRRAFVSGVEALLQGLKAGSPPTDAEINAALETSSSRSMFGRNRAAATLPSGASPGGMSRQIRSFRMMTEADRRMVAKVCEDKAKAAKVYASPLDIGGYAYWSDWKFEDWDKATKDAWYWQMAYWMIEDVATTIRQMNKDSPNILASPVKRIMSVLFTQSRMSRMTIGGRSRRASAMPKDKQTPTYVTGIRNAMTGTPCTGRFSSPAADAVMDVMHFEVQVIVSADEVMRFIQELCSAKTHKFRGWRGDEPERTYKHNQISILESSITPVDREGVEHSGYEYGLDEVVTLDLTCEYVFHVAAYGKIQPKVVQEDVVNATTPAKK